MVPVIQALKAFVLGALLSWTALPSPVLEPWAEAIAKVSSDARQAAWLAAVAFEEGGFARYVLDGRCNDLAWLAKQRGCHVRGGWCPCDAGNAYGPWQLHRGAWLGEGRDPKGATPLEQARMASGLGEGAWTRAAAGRARARAWLGRHPFTYHPSD